MRTRRARARGAKAAGALAMLAGAALAGWALAVGVGRPEPAHGAPARRTDQLELNRLVWQNYRGGAFQRAFEAGDELFGAAFDERDGLGANVGEGLRFTKVPRADLAGGGEWARHAPQRATGPNDRSCTACHSQPAEDGAGGLEFNVLRDPAHSGDPARFVNRNPTHLFGLGARQRLAEEMTAELHAIRAGAREAACGGARVTVALTAKGIDFGRLTVVPVDSPCAIEEDASGIVGVDADLVVKPLQWKGSHAFIRDFNRIAAHHELGLQPVELVGDGVDADFDGVANELTIGEQTALAVYVAAQPRPTTRTELAALRLGEPLAVEEVQAIDRGGKLFRSVGCASCHVPRLMLDDPVFSEPSRHPAYRDAVFPGGQNPRARGVDPAVAVTFDLTLDQPDNRVLDPNGRIVHRLGSFPKDERGRAAVDLFGDLKRHDLGPELAEPIDEVGTGAATFLTANLWGVGSTAPYLHDGRAATLAEAVALHGGEAAAARAAYRALSPDEQRDLVAFLENLVLFKLPEVEGGPAERD